MHRNRLQFLSVILTILVLLPFAIQQQVLSTSGYRLGSETLSRVPPQATTTTDDVPLFIDDLDLQANLTDIQAVQSIPTGIKRTGNTHDTISSLGILASGIDIDIAIIDSGIDLGHPDLNVYRSINTMTVPVGQNISGKLSPGNKTFYPPFSSNATSSVDDNCGHGTHVAGLAAARDNNIGIVGASPGARLWNIKVIDFNQSTGKCEGAISSVISAIEYVTKNSDQIDVAILSFGCLCKSEALNEAIHRSVAKGVTFVVAAGNSGMDAASFSPASHPDVITVSAIADGDGKCGSAGIPLWIDAGNMSGLYVDDSFAPFSNYGLPIDIAAPGVGLESTYLNGTYAKKGGTSNAAALVGGSAAILKAFNPQASPPDIRAALIGSGSTPATICDGKSHGYFIDDIDTIQEPLLYMDNPSGKSLLSQNVHFKTFESSAFGLSINYPYNWKTTEDNNTIRFISPLEDDFDKFNEQLSISVSSFPMSPENIPLNTLVSETISYHRENSSDFSLIESNSTNMLASNKAHKIVFLDKRGHLSDSLMHLMIHMIDNDKAYRIAFDGQVIRFLDYLPTIHKMIDSFEVEASNETDDSALPIGSGLKLANDPSDLAIDLDTNRLYVANRGSNTISVIDESRYTILNNITIGNVPIGIAISPTSGRIYAANLGSNTASVVDSVTNNILRNDIVLGGDPADIAVDPEESLIFVSNSGSNTVSVINDLILDTVYNFTVGNSPTGIGINSVINRLYVANINSNTLSVIDFFTSQDDGFEYKSAANITLGKHPFMIGINSNTNKVYVTNSGSDTVSVIDGLTNEIVTDIPVGNSPRGITVNPNTNKVYVTNSGSDTVSVIDGLTNEIVTDIPVGNRPWDIIANPVTNTIYVASAGSDRIHVINGNTDKVIAGVTFNVNPPNSGKIFCNGLEISDNDYIKYDINVRLKCEAKTNSVFPPIIFSSWFTDLGSNSRYITNPSSTFEVSQYGKVTANFKELIPSEYLTTNIIIPAMLGIIIPTLGGWFFAKRRRSHLNRYIKAVNVAYDAPQQSREKSIRRLESLRKEMTEQYNKGKISDENYEMLGKKISECMEDIRSK